MNPIKLCRKNLKSSPRSIGLNGIHWGSKIPNVTRIVNFDILANELVNDESAAKSSNSVIEHAL